jgi:hypothetical protein
MRKAKPWLKPSCSPDCSTGPVDIIYLKK